MNLRAIINASSNAADFAHLGQSRQSHINAASRFAWQAVHELASCEWLMAHGGSRFPQPAHG
jgi:hypothetical protein